MNLVDIEVSRVISLAKLSRPQGAPFLLDVLRAVIARYNFQHFPERMPAAGSSDPLRLQMGKFEETQVDELTAYRDGFIVSARADTQFIDAFLDDLYAFLAEQFDSVRVQGVPEVRRHESSLVVTMNERVDAKFSFLDNFYTQLSKLGSNNGVVGNYAFGGFHAEIEAIQTGSSAPRFVLERRINAAFSANQWYSNALLKTKDHVAVLTSLEKQLLS